MNVDAGALRELHRIHRQVTDLRQRLDQGPKQVKASEGNLKRFEDDAARLKEAVKQVKLGAAQKELQLKERENRIRDLRIKLNACGTNREYQALMEQIAADEKANSVLSDEILEMLEKVEMQQAQAAEAGSKVAKTREELDKTRARVADEQRALEVELARASSELKRVETTLPADLRKDFDRIAKARGEDAMAQVEGEVCGGCYQTLTPQMLNQLALGQAVFCKSCGRLLYLPEDRSVK
jgi:predicted  nucleic acid-binding Zn-ribbon protein